MQGTLYLSIQQPIKCRGVRVHIQGKGHSRFITGSGDDKETRTHTQYYTNCKRTVFGNVHKTPVINEAGANAIFGPPWAPDEGILLINLPMTANILILQAMDYAWLKRDALLGEVLVDINQCVGRGQLECKLMRNGKPESGSIYFQMDWDLSNTSTDSFGNQYRCLRLQVYRCLGLRSAEWFGKNDVYVQAYALPDNAQIVPNKALPSPSVDLILNPGEMVIPFTFQLPSDLPSSIVREGDNYIAYSIYSNIDIAWKQDPSTRAFFTVMQPHPASLMMWPMKQDVHPALYQQCCIPPFCCCSFSLDCMGALGTLHLAAATDRGSYAPGENIIMNMSLNSDYSEFLSRIQSVSITLRQHVRLWAEGYTEHRDYSCASLRIQPTQTQIIMQVPPISPTYNGGLGQDAGWLGEARRYGGRWAMQRPDPIIWSYTLDLTVSINLPGVTLVARDYTLRFPIVISGIGLALLGIQPPPMQQLLAQQHQPPMMMASAPGYPQQQPGMVGFANPQSFLPVGSDPGMMRGASASVVPANTNFHASQPQLPPMMGMGIGQQPAVAFPPPVHQQQQVLPPQQSMGPTGTVVSLPHQQQQPLQSPPEGGGYGGNSTGVNQSMGGYSNINTAGQSNAYGFTGNIQWKDDEHVKQALPALRACQMVPSSYNACMIRDAEEDFNPQDMNELNYKPMFYMSPPVHSN